MPHAFLCDFDGTVSPFDIGAAFARRFSHGAAAESPAFLARWMRGEMGHRELTEAQCALLSVTREEALAFARPFALDPHFASFVREADGRGDAVIVVSEGFDFYVRDLLAWCRQEGIEAMPFETFADVRGLSFDQAPAGVGPGVPRGVGRPRSAARGARSRGPATSGNPWPRTRRS